MVLHDGNGRTGRILIFKECLKNNLIPLIINDKAKILYYKALNAAQINNDYEALLNMFKREQQIYFEKTKEFIFDYQELENSKTKGLSYINDLGTKSEKNANVQPKEKEQER